MLDGENDLGPLITYGNIATLVLERLREMIMAGQLKPGQWLKQDELASQLGVSTMPVREALRRLEAEGIVKFYPRRGARVVQMSSAEMEELWSIREELAVLACRWVGEDMTRIPMERLSQTFADLQDAATNGDIRRRLELSRAFFFTIFEASEKGHLVRILSNVWDASFQYRLYYLKVASQSTGIALEPYYQQIFDACEVHDRQALVKRMQQAWQYIRKSDIQREFVRYLHEMEQGNDPNE